MTKKELIEKIMALNVVNVEQKPDYLFETLKGYCEEYKQTTGDDSLDSLFEDYYSPEQQTELVQEMIEEATTYCNENLEDIQTLLRPRRYDTDYARRFNDYFTDIDYRDLAELKHNILRVLIPNKRKQHYIQLLKDISDTDPDDIMDRINQINRWYTEDYNVPMANDIMRDYLTYDEAHKYIGNLLEIQGIYRVAFCLNSLIEADRYTSEHFYIDNDSWNLHFVHAEDAEALKQKLINILQEEIDND